MKQLLECVRHNGLTVSYNPRNWQMCMPANNDDAARTWRHDGIEKTNNNATGQGMSAALRTDVQE